MKKECFFDCYCGQQFYALLEDGVLTEFCAEKEGLGTPIGNIYKGRVANVLAGMSAAFVYCGLDKNCYLSTEEFYTNYSKYDGTVVEMNSDLRKLQVGDEVLVQITKPTRGNKGAKVTTLLSLVGKNLIYLPNTGFLGISKKITDEETREKLLKTAEKLRERNDEGFVVRTHATNATPRQLKKESAYLKTLYKDMLERAKTANVGDLIYRDDDLPARIVRDSFGEDLIAIRVGNAELYERLLKLIRLQKEIPERKLILHNGERSMLREYGISQMLYEAVGPTVPLDNGGYIVIDQTEAMTVIDVNTGSYVDGINHEQTVFTVNLAAAKEIARQVRLRNIGGIIVVDFIDMLDEGHKTRVTEVLREYLAKDKTKCNVLEMSELCLTQFTRKRVGNDMTEYLLKPCNDCKGNGHVHADIFVYTRLRADLLDCFANGFNSAIVDLNDTIMRQILTEGIFTRDVKGRWKDKRIYLVPHRTYKEEQFTIRGDNAEILNLPDNAKLLY